DDPGQAVVGRQQQRGGGGQEERRGQHRGEYCMGVGDVHGRPVRKSCVIMPPRTRQASAQPPGEASSMGSSAVAGQDRLIWIDLEMTGLDTDADSILEIATVVTDSQLNILAEGP